MRPEQRQVLRELAGAIMVAGIVLLLAFMFLAAVDPTPAHAAVWKPLGVRASAVASDFGGTYWNSPVKPANPIYQGKTLVKRAPESGELLPYLFMQEGYNGLATVSVVSTQVTYPSVIQQLRADHPDVTDAELSWALARTPYIANLGAAGATLASWCREALAGSNRSPLRWKVYDHSPGAYMNIESVESYGGQKAKINFSNSGYFAQSTFSPESNADALCNQGNQVPGEYGTQTARTGGAPFSVTSDVIHPEGNWKFLAVVGFSASIGIYDDALKPENGNHAWVISSHTTGLDFGITREPSKKNAAGNTNVGTPAEQYVLGNMGLIAGVSDKRVVYKRAFIKAWGGRNADNTYWYSWKETWTFGQPQGFFGDMYQASGHVDSTPSAPPLYVKQASSGATSLVEPTLILHNGANEAVPTDLMPGAPAGTTFMPVWGDWYSYAGYQDNLASAVTTSSMDATVAPGLESGEPSAPETNTQTIGSGSTTGTIDFALPAWLSEFQPVVDWTQETLGGVGTQITDGLAGPLGGLVWPYHSLEEF